MDALKLAVLSNLVLCCFHQAEYAQSALYASKAMDHDPGSVKLLLRRARALSMKVGVWWPFVRTTTTGRAEMF